MTTQGLGKPFSRQRHHNFRRRRGRRVTDASYVELRGEAAGAPQGRFMGFSAQGGSIGASDASFTEEITRLHHCRHATSLALTK